MVETAAMFPLGLHTDLFAILNRFPEREKMVKKLFTKNENFQSMCKDYRQCREAFAYWSQPDIKNSLMRIKEYAALIEDLEAEIIRYLDENTYKKSGI